MNVLRVIAGFAFSILVGHIVLWLLIEKTLWPYVRKHHPPDPDHQKSRLSWMVGILERTIYTGAFMPLGAVWLDRSVDCPGAYAHARQHQDHEPRAVGVRLTQSMRPRIHKSPES